MRRAKSTDRLFRNVLRNYHCSLRSSPEELNSLDVTTQNIVTWHEVIPALIWTQNLERSVATADLTQGDQKVSAHLMITIQKITSNFQSVRRQSPDIY
jgi:hypothetical protein